MLNDVKQASYTFVQFESEMSKNWIPTQLETFKELFLAPCCGYIERDSHQHCVRPVQTKTCVFKRIKKILGIKWFYENILCK